LRRRRLDDSGEQKDPLDGALDSVDDALDKRLSSIERRTSERISRIGSRLGRDRGEALVQRASSSQTTPWGPKSMPYKAEIVAERPPASLRIRLAGEAIEIEPQISNSPMETGPETLEIDDEFLNAVCLSRCLTDDTCPEHVAAALVNAQCELGARMPATLVQRLSELAPGTPLALRIDTQLLDIPWEFTPLATAGGMRIMDLHPVGRIAVARHHIPEARPQESREKLSLLVFGDPDGTLGDAGVNQTLDELEQELADWHAEDVQPTVHRGPITRDFALETLAQGGWDVVFYMGHGCLEPCSGFAFAGEGMDAILTAQQVHDALQPARAPRIWLADACVSARMPRDGQEPSPLAAMVLALAARGTSYVGTSWSIHTPSAVGFALGCIGAMLQGFPLGVCVSVARQFCYLEWELISGFKMGSDPDPEAFTLYGDPGMKVVIS